MRTKKIAGNNKSPIVSVLVITAVVVGGGMYWWQSSQTSQSTTELDIQTIKEISAEPETVESVTEILNEAAETQSYKNNEFNISFSYPNDWTIEERKSESGESIRIIVENPSGPIDEHENNILCPYFHEIEFYFPQRDYGSQKFEDNIPYKESGGLAVFYGNLIPTTLAGKNAYQGAYGDGCGGMDYIVEQAEQRYWIINVPDMSEKDMSEIYKILNSLSL